MPISFDLSSSAELQPLAEVVSRLDDALRGATDRWLIVGAYARDLILHHAYQIPISRFTADLDIAVAVPSWGAFQVLEQTLLASGATQEKNIAHRFFLSGWAIDVIPFEGVEEDGEITWPDGMAMSIVGFSEASTDALRILLPHNIPVDIASLPAQRVAAILEREAAGETLLLASDMNGRAEDNLDLLRALLFGFSV